MHISKLLSELQCVADAVANQAEAWNVDQEIVFDNYTVEEFLGLITDELIPTIEAALPDGTVNKNDFIKGLRRIDGEVKKLDFQFDGDRA